MTILHYAPEAPGHRVPSSLHGRANRWLVADEWFAAFIRDLEASPRRVTALRREARRGVPVSHRRAVQYEQETEQYLKYLRHEREKQDAEEGVEGRVPA